MATHPAAILKRVVQSVSNADSSAVSDRELLRRFAERNDQAAFTALVRRHTGMVFGVCRRVLPTVQDAEDACQATFVVLAGKARSGHWQPSVSNWLYATARKIAKNARVAAERRARREDRAGVLRAIEPLDRMTGRELIAVLDEELDKLPPRYREPIVLCYLEGLTRDEAGVRLGVPLTTLKIRLERGRKKLSDALLRRGWALGAGALTLAATSAAGASPPRLIQAVLASVSGRTPAAVAELAKGVAMNGILNKSVLAVLLLVGAAALGIGLGSVTPTAAGPLPDKNPPKVAPKPPDAAKDTTVSGRVLDPDGKPVAGARLHLTPAFGYLHEAYSSAESVTTGPDGRFAFPEKKDRDHGIIVAATAPNFGVGWVRIKSDEQRGDLTLQLVTDDTPITGQVVNLEGKPVPGATLRVMQINAAPNEDLGPWLEAVTGKKGTSLELAQKHVPRYTIAPSRTITTDAQGRFQLTGIGPNRLIRVQLDGPTIVSEILHMRTQSGKNIEVTDHEGNTKYNERRMVTTFYPANFRHTAAPSRPIIGVVRDKDTKKPLAGVTIRSYARATGAGSFQILDIVRTTTDAEGRYRLTGMAKGEGYKIAAIPTRDQPYVIGNRDVPEGPGLDPVTVDFEMKRGVWIEGKITDKATGKSVKTALEYFSMYSNPNLQDYRGFDGTIIMDRDGAGVKDDGTYRIVGLPGPGLIAVYTNGPYLRAPTRDDEFGTTEQRLSTAPYHLMFTSNYGALARIDPAKGVDSIKCDVTLDPGWAFKGTVVGPDGKPLTRARSLGVTRSRWYDRERMKTPEFTVEAFHPRHRRDVLFQYPETGLIGIAEPPKENGGTITVRMIPGATVRGRLVDADGKPRAGVELETRFRRKGESYWAEFSEEHVKTDQEGRFQIESLIPGFEFQLRDGQATVQFGDGLRSGEVKDLGDMRVKPWQ